MWIEANPELLLSLPDEPVKLVDIPHTPLVAYTTRLLVTVLNQYTLIPVATHTRQQKLADQHGHNVDVKTKHITVHLAQLQKLVQFELVVETLNHYLIVYHGRVEPHRHLYEVHKGDQVLQLGLPVASDQLPWLLRLIFQLALKLLAPPPQPIMVETSQENNDDDNFAIELVRLTVFKVLKILIGIDRWWLKANSHNLIVFSQDQLQVVNLQSFKHEVVSLADQSWYSGSQVKFIEYNPYQGYFLAVNAANELWYFELTKGDSGIATTGHRVYLFAGLHTVKISFSSQGLTLIQLNSSLRLFSESFALIKLVPAPELVEIVWAPSGQFYVAIDHDTGHYRLVSRMGHTTFDLAIIQQELTQPFVKARQCVIAGNSEVMYVVGDKLWQLRLQSVTDNGHLFYTHDYFGTVSRRVTKYPIPPRLKRVMARIDGNASTYYIHHSLSGQYAITYGDHIAVLTPATTPPLNWYFCENTHEPINVVFSFWFRDFLGVIVRDDTTDEVVVFDSRHTKYTHSSFGFDTELVVAKYAVSARVGACHMTGLTLVMMLTNQITMVQFTTNQDKVTLSGSLINLLLIKNQLNTRLVSQVDKVGDHFLLLMTTGDFMILHSLGGSQYELVLISKGVEWFRIDSVAYRDGSADYVYALCRDTVFVYPLAAVCAGDTPQPLAITVSGFLPLRLCLTAKLIDLVGLEHVVNHNRLAVKTGHRGVLHQFIEHDLVHTPKELVVPRLLSRYSGYDSYNYCLEVLLVRYLTEVDKPQVLDKLMEVVDDLVYINCLRKIEVGYWDKFFTALGTTAEDYMAKLIEKGDVERCYHYLIIYLNADTKDDVDNEVILKIFRMLQRAGRWDWCFELCRFVKLIDRDFLLELRREIVDDDTKLAVEADEKLILS